MPNLSSVIWTVIQGLNQALLSVLLFALVIIGLWHIMFSIAAFERITLDIGYNAKLHRQPTWLQIVFATVVTTLLLILPLRVLFSCLILLALITLYLAIRHSIYTHKRFHGGKDAIDTELLKRHVIIIDQDGIALEPLPRHRFGHYFGIAPEFRTLSRDDFEHYMSTITTTINHQNPDHEVVFFVHGGLSNYKNALQLTDKRISAMLTDGKYPIFIMWRSGLVPCYWSHLTEFIQGKTSVRYLPYKIVLFFVNVIADFGRGITRFPKTVYYQVRSELSGLFPIIDRDARNIPPLYKILRQRKLNAFKIKRGWVNDDLYIQFRNKLRLEFFSPLKLVFRYTVWPIIDVFGTSAWDIMLRRTETLFRSPYEFDVRVHSHHAYAPEPVKPNRSSDDVNSLDTLPTGALSIFIRKYMKEVKTPTLLIGHSMGTIVINNWLTMFPEFKASKVIYMGAACTIQHTVRSVAPFLQRFQESTFYNLMLHQRAEKIEQHAFGLSPMGSLLEWIDNYFSKPLTFDQRTFGKWDNLIQATHLFPHALRSRITLKAFSLYLNQHDEFFPTKHGDFSSCKFWREDFYTITPKDLKEEKEEKEEEDDSKGLPAVAENPSG